MAFKSSNLTSKTRYMTGISTFAGVDYSTQRFKVDQNRAIDLQNFIYKDGIIQKREGFEELISLNPAHYIPLNADIKEYKINEVNFNGMWSITGEDKQLHIIAHIGRLLYEVKNIGTQEIELVLLHDSKAPETYNGYLHYYCYEFENYKSSAFVGANKLYFLGGNKFMCIRFIGGNTYMYPVENHSETYIPTTTTSITYANSVASGRASLDKVNLMTQWRRNKLLSGTLKVEDEKIKTQYYEYTLDSPLIPKEQKDMSVIEIILEERGTIE